MMGIMDRFKDIRPIGLENLDEEELTPEDEERATRALAEWKAGFLKTEEGKRILAELDSEK